MQTYVRNIADYVLHIVYYTDYFQYVNTFAENFPTRLGGIL